MFSTQSRHSHRTSDYGTPPVVVYGTSWCAASQMVRRHLDQLGIPYTWRDMEYDSSAANRVRWWTGGSFSHPTVQIGGQILVEPSLNELDWALSDAGIL